MPHITASARAQHRHCRLRASVRVSLGAMVGMGLLIPSTFAATDVIRRGFDIPAGDAAETLKLFAAQSGEQLLYSPDDVSERQTRAVRGKLAPMAALEHMLKGTPLKARQDGNTKAIAITAIAASPTAPSSTAPDTPSPASPSQRPIEEPPKTMNRKNPIAIIAGWLALAASPAGAQTVPAAAPTSTNAETITLSPFTVTSDKDEGYAASSSLAGSRVRTDLRDIAAPISVLTKDFLDDIAAVNLQEALSYATGMENYAQSVDPAAANPDSDQRAPNANRVRGLGGANTTRNFFSTNVRLDTYNTTRLDLSRGPNAILFGLGSPSGIINTSVQRAAFRNSAALGTRFDSEGSHRFNFSVNRQIVPQKLAVFAAGLHEEAETWRKPSLDHQNRGYVALQAQPFRTTTLNVNYEDYWNFRRMARALLFMDGVSVWINAGRPMLATRPTQRVTDLPPSLTQLGGGAAAVMINGSVGTVPQFPTSAWEVRTKAPHEFLTGPDAFGLTFKDGSIIPLDRNILGTASFAEMDGRILNASVEQRVGPDLNFELAYNREKSRNMLLDLANFGQATGVIYADPNLQLANGDPNPNAGRFFMETNPRGLDRRDTTDALRLTGSYQLDLTDRSGRIRWLGRHVFTGLAAEEREETLNDVMREFISSNHAWLPAAAQDNLTHATRAFKRRFYFDDPNNLKGGNLTAVVDHLRLDGQVIGADGLPVISDPFRTGTFANTHNRIETRSFVGVWQGYFWDRRIVTTVGRRRDRQKIYRAATARDALGLFVPATEMVLPRSPEQDEAGNTFTKGVAFHPTKWLSLYYNEADTFALSGGNIDAYNRLLPGASGEGQDYGLGLLLWGGRLSLRVNRYETAQINGLAGPYRNVRQPFSYIEDAIAAFTGQPRGDFAHFDAWTTQNLVAKGHELEAVANPTPQLRIAFNASQQKSVLSNVALAARRLYAERRPVWEPYLSLPAEGGPEATIQSNADRIKAILDLAEASDGVANARVVEWRWNAVANYTFARTSKLRGFGVGTGVRWSGKPVVGYQNKIVGGQAVIDITKPWYGAEGFNVDAWVRYQGKILSRLPVRIQLNIRNLLDEDELKPTRVRSDRSGAGYQALAPRLFVLSTSFSL